MRSTLLYLAGSLALSVNALVLEKRAAPSVLSVPFVREPSVALRHRKRSGEVLAPLTNEPLLLYTATLQIGTPPQATRAQIDTGSSYLIVETDSSNLCTLDPTVCSIRGAYNANSSSTYEYIDSDLSILYGGGDGTTGDDCFDVLSIGGAVIPKYRFGIMYQTTVGSGVLGISYQPQNTAPFQGTPQEGNLPTILASEGFIASRAYSLWLNDAHASSGQLLFGGVDTEKFKGNLVTIDIVPEVQGEPIKSFIIPLVEVTVTDSTGSLVTLTGGSSPGLVNLDSGTTFFSLPSDITNSIYAALNAVVNSGAAFVDCSLATTSATINLGFQGIIIAIPVGQLILDGGGGTSCQLGLSISSGTSFLGDTALTSMYVVYDMDNNQISLAETVFNAEASNILQIMAGPNGVPNAPGVGGTTAGISTTSTSSSSSTASTSSSSSATSTSSSSSTASTSSSSSTASTSSSSSATSTSSSSSHTSTSSSSSAASTSSSSSRTSTSSSSSTASTSSSSSAASTSSSNSHTSASSSSSAASTSSSSSHSSTSSSSSTASTLSSSSTASTSSSSSHSSTSSSSSTASTLSSSSTASTSSSSSAASTSSSSSHTSASSLSSAASTSSSSSHTSASSSSSAASTSSSSSHSSTSSSSSATSTSSSSSHTSASSSSSTASTLTKSTSTKIAPLKCRSDNCLRAFGSRPEAAAFCATYTVGGSQVLPTYAVKGCSSSAVRVSSACSCINTGIVVAPTITPTATASPASTTALIITKPMSTSTSLPQLLICKKNNCLRAMQHSSVTAFCSSFLAGQPVATPVGVAAGCMKAASRISSGCACVATAA